MRMEIGRWNTPSHYSVEGTSTSFYIWARENRIEAGKQYASGRITGTEAFEHFNKLKEHFDKSSKREFVEYIKMLKEKYTNAKI